MSEKINFVNFKLKPSSMVILKTHIYFEYFELCL